MDNLYHYLYDYSTPNNHHRLTRSPLVPPAKIPNSTQYPESLSSYLSRSASTLFMSKSELIENFVLPRTNLNYDIRFLDNGRDTYSINSTGKAAHEFERASKILFPVKEHDEFSTFSFLTPLLGVKAKGVMSKHLKWCPICIKKWTLDGIEPYYPLYWLAQNSTICLTHKCLLEKNCPHCQKHQPIISATSNNGKCIFCEAELSESSQHGDMSNIDEWNSFSINNLVVYREDIRQLDSLSNFREFVSKLISLYGTAKNVEQTFGLSESLIVRWKKRNRPQLSQLLDLSYKMQTPISSILMGRKDSPTSQQPKLFGTQKEVHSRKRPKKTVLALEKELNKYLAQSPKPSIRDAGKALIVSEGFLRYRFPSITKQLGALSRANSENGLRQREQQLYLSSLELLIAAYNAGTPIQSHQIREILDDMPGAAHFSLIRLRSFLLKSRLNNEKRNFIDLLKGLNCEKMLLNELNTKE